jgi:hypothetical protein
LIAAAGQQRQRPGTLGSNSRSFNPAAVPKVGLPFLRDSRRTDARFPAPFSRRLPIILPDASFVLHVAEHRAWSAFTVTAGGHFS